MPIQAPQWSDYKNCPVCRREFGAPPRSPVSLGCGHTLCRHCLKHLHKKQCPFDQTVIEVEPEELVINTALLQLVGYPPPSQPYHPPCIQALCERDRRAYDAVVRCMETLAGLFKYCGNAANNSTASRLSRPMQRKLVTLLQCCVTDEEGRGRCARAARSLGERSVTELILQHQNPQQLSANLWAAVRARGCQFLGPAMQEEVLKLVLLALEDGSALSRKVLVMFVVQRLEPHFTQASKTSIGHVVQLLYRASCFKVSKRESDSSLMQLKEEFRTYESLRREHDAQIVQIATEAGLRIAPDQWSALLYGDTVHKSHMQSIIDKLQTPQSFAQSVQELFVALQRTGDPAQLIVMSMHLDRLAGIDASPDAKSPTWQQLAEVMTSLKEVFSGLIHYLQQQSTTRDSNHNQKHVAPDRCAEPSTSQPSPQAATTPTHTKYKVSMCRDAAARSFCPRGAACTFAHSEEELERYRAYLSANPTVNGNYPYHGQMPPGPPGLPLPLPSRPVPARPVMYQRFPMPPPATYNVPPLTSLPPPNIQTEMLQNQEYNQESHAESGQPSNFHLHNQPLLQNGMLLPDRQYYRGMLPVPEEPYREYMPVYQSGYQENMPAMFDNVQYNGIESLPAEPRPEFRMDPNYAIVNRERHIEQTWTPVNEAFFEGNVRQSFNNDNEDNFFEGAGNVRQPFQNDAEDIFAAGDRRAVGADWLASADRNAVQYSRADENTMLLFITIGFVCFPIVQGLETEVVVLRAVRGQDARLPCGQGKVFLDGPDAYVLWLKSDREFLYRFPNEETERRSLSFDQVFGTTCVAGACHDDTSLLIKRVSDRDGGIYRCRVHYQASPSVDYVIEIRLVDSPGMPRIYNEAGEPLKRGHIQHLSIGANLTLACEVDDEQPDTLVFWRRNGAVVERAHASHGSLRATVRVRNATRAELDAHYECLAQNADVTDPLSASVLVTMYLPPLSVEIRLNNNLDFEAGQPRVVDCVVVGCVPPPSVTWHLGDTLLRPSVHKELHDGNYTVSSLTLAPSLRDSGRELACRAHNSHLPTSVFQDKVTLNVGYRPVCLSSAEETVGAVQREAETVACTVDASPEPLQFSWTFPDSRTLYTSVKKIPGHHHRYSSTLTWLPRESDIGPLLCRATNSFGEQKRPCAFMVAAGGAPSTPQCVLLRAYPDALRVQCKKGWDGGRSQTIHLTVRDVDGTLLHNVTDTAGHFHLHGVGDRNLSAVVYASNVRGRSGETVLLMEAATPLSASRELAEATSHSWTRWLEVAAGAIAVTAAVAATALCVRALRARRELEMNPDLVPRSDGTFHREPDFVGGERVLGTTNITVNQLASCQNQYSSSPVPSCRVLVGCPHPAPDPCPSTQHSYFV